MTEQPADDWRGRALAAEAAAEELRRERARLWEELHRLRARERDVEYFRRRHEQVETSLSWRITSPLRLVLGYARKARKLLEDRSA